MGIYTVLCCVFWGGGGYCLRTPWPHLCVCVCCTQQRARAAARWINMDDRRLSACTPAIVRICVCLCVVCILAFYGLPLNPCHSLTLTPNVCEYCECDGVLGGAVMRTCGVFVRHFIGVCECAAACRRA